MIAQLSWYPAFAGRYTSAWGKEYGPCKTREMAKGKEAERTYYDVAMWQTCRPAAMKAHDTALGTGGSGHEATPPFVMRALYGPKVRLRRTTLPWANGLPSSRVHTSVGSVYTSTQLAHAIQVRLVSALRNPVDRLETSFWEHRHYMLKYGANAEGLHKYVVEQTAAFDRCARAHDSRRRAPHLPMTRAARGIGRVGEPCL